MDSRKVGFYLERTTRKVKLSFTQLFADMQVDLTPEQWVIIDNLYQNNGLSQIDLATNSFKNAPTISRIIDLLEKKSLVERKRFENDRRKFKIYLTPNGKELYEKIIPEVKKLRVKSWEGLSEKDYDSFLRIINKVFSNFE